jgi:hypothetical protein
MSLRNRPLPTEIVEKAADFRPTSGAAYVFGRSIEDRSGHVEEWRAAASDVSMISLDEFTASGFRYTASSHEQRVSLRSERALGEFWSSVKADVWYLDITGLPHHVWAPLLRAGLQSGGTLRAVYAEPVEYRFQASPTPSDIFDLSERIQGVAPIPGFVSLTDERDEAAAVFVPLLGFEGARFSYLLEQVQPPGDKVVPVVGVPGFRPEYPFYTYQGNRQALWDSGAWKNARFAIANCPFSLYYQLEDIVRDYSGDRLKIAPIGTKPHALGAVLFVVSSSDPVELVYDHPIRKAKRTEGAARVLIYHVSRFCGT